MRDYEHEEREEEEPQEVPMNVVDEPGPCTICGKPGQKFGCFRCGRPVCYHPTDYFSDSACGGWVLDTWHPGHPDENEFYCQVCLCAGLIAPEGVSVASGGLFFKYAESGALQVTINGGQPQELSVEDSRSLVAYLYDGRGELFGLPYDPDAVEAEEHKAEMEELEELLLLTSDSVDLDGQPF